MFLMNSGDMFWRTQGTQSLFKKKGLCPELSGREEFSGHVTKSRDLVHVPEFFVPEFDAMPPLSFLKHMGFKQFENIFFGHELKVRGPLDKGPDVFDGLFPIDVVDASGNKRSPV